MRASILAGTLALIGLTQPNVATAQKPLDGADIVRQMHDRYVGKWYRTLSFTQSTLRRTPADTMVHETWYEVMKLPGTLRIDIGTPTGNPVVLYAHDSIYVHGASGPRPPRAGRNPLLILGFDVYTQPVERSVSTLRQEGFDLSKTHEATWEGRRVLVIGAAAGDTTSKQFWVDADRLLFVRMVGPEAAGKPALEDVRFEKYQPAGGGWIATLVTATRSGQLVQQEEYSDIRVNPPVPDGRLDPSRLGQP